MARKWQRMARIKRRKISLPRKRMKHKVAEKGHFVVYTADKVRFVVPLTYLRNNIFRELLRMSEEQFGLHIDGPIILPCDAAFMEYVVSLVQKHLSLELQNALQLIASLGFGFGSNCHCLTPMPASQPLAVV
ncbi:auxin-responsive protein SAUR68-like [Abrus precatorius]|uniref:Auxin-responsive protein SAUR68-like n=1 Tax=Abrus precatorius TaxID=3816 RepID=A0A8B8MLY6_ABRPR|nr:auxin-responsive protein SAUR68-like [Abrus precatorius]